MIKNKMRPIPPGEILLEQLEALEMSATKLAERLRVPANRISRILASTTAITPDTALRLARFFDTTPEFWINLQSAYDLRIAEQDASSRRAYLAIRPFAEQPAPPRSSRRPKEKSGGAESHTESQFSRHA